MTFVFSFGFIFLFYKIAIDATSGFYIHYANYMASRTYLTYENNTNTPGSSDNPALVEARRVFDSYKPTVMIKDFNGTLSANDPESVGNQLYVGTFVEYTIPFSFTAMIGGKEPVKYFSESFLGREPTRSECSLRVCKSMEDLGAQCQTNITFYDNGC
ncbi:hypothetical protein [Halobacteriovorax sp. HLS]|uniref:hypothetical protein n=1 Tax=Halobacteriovorax sp. HLS TaxID=2234000 RepID=UPI000FDCD22A|nr:hypothetical protein [Halobacteriovorax sp. HLS]